MITALSQRWRERRDSYRPAGETIRTADYEVSQLLDDTTPRRFVERHHYEHSYVASERRFGLHRRTGELVGVAIFSVTWKHVRKVFGPAAADATNLGRFVLLDEVPANGETWFLARAFELLARESFTGVVSFADPEPRIDLSGRTVFKGHIGNIYQAFNARYLGRSSRATKYLLPDGTIFDNRCTGKIRKGETGHRYAIGLLESHGAERFRGGDVVAWMKRALDQVARRVRHPGNHRYVWPLNRRVRRHLPEGLPYPKFEMRRAA